MEKLCTKAWVSWQIQNRFRSILDVIGRRTLFHALWLLGEFNFREEKESGDFNQVVKAKNVVMIAGGTGIAPMLQIVRDVLKDQTDNVSLRHALFHCQYVTINILDKYGFTLC